MKQRSTPVRLTHDTIVQHVSEGGQRIPVTLPRGSKLELPSEWVYIGVPAEQINPNDLIDPPRPKQECAEVAAPEQVTLVLSRNDAGQLLDGLRVRKESWDNTAQFLESGYNPDDTMIEECSDSGEAESIAAHYSEIISSIETQMKGGALAVDPSKLAQCQCRIREIQGAYGSFEFVITRDFGHRELRLAVNPQTLSEWTVASKSQLVQDYGTVTPVGFLRRAIAFLQLDIEQGAGSEVPSSDTRTVITSTGEVTTYCPARDENIAAIAAEIHAHKNWEEFYRNNCDALGGFPGFWIYSVDAANAFTAAETAINAASTDDTGDNFEYPESIFFYVGSIMTALTLPTLADLRVLADAAIKQNAYEKQGGK